MEATGGRGVSKGTSGGHWRYGCGYGNKWRPLEVGVWGSEQVEATGGSGVSLVTNGGQWCRVVRQGTTAGRVQRLTYRGWRRGGTGCQPPYDEVIS